MEFDAELEVELIEAQAERMELQAKCDRLSAQIAELSERSERSERSDLSVPSPSGPACT